MSAPGTLPWRRKLRKSAVSANWHGSCNTFGIGGMVRRIDEGNTMTTISNYSQQILAGIGALAISALLFANTLAVQTAEVHSVVGILA